MLSGLLLIDKPQGLTSHDVVHSIRRKLNLKTVGHTGTLDPMATGLLPILLGEATKLSEFFIRYPKTYALTCQLGLTTTTLDAQGAPLVRKDFAHLFDRDIFAQAMELQGAFNWPIPLYSAKKIEGKPLYKHAFEGKADRLLDLPQKVMSFYGLKNLKYERTQGQFSAELSCESGGFIRTWSSQLGEALSVGSHLTSLRRIKTGGFSIEEALSLSSFLDLDFSATQLNSNSSFFPLRKLMPEWDSVMVEGKDLKLLRNGQVSYDLDRRLIRIQKLSYQQNKSIEIKVFNRNYQLQSILQARLGEGLKVKRTFCYSN